jgi:tRNA A37 threonylcarbamoyladenosine modification protein TsaB
VKNSLTFSDLHGIVVVNGPGGFTAMRIVTLMVNTIAFVHKIPLYALDFFKLAMLGGLDYPMLIKANKGEYLLKKSKNDLPSIVSIDTISEGRYSGLGDTNDFTNKKILIQSEINYNLVIQMLSFDKSQERIEPLYIKKPNIT